MRRLQSNNFFRIGTCFILIFLALEKKTSRERPQSASYLRLYNIQGKTQPIVKFFIYHTVQKNPERVFPKTQKQFFSALETSEKTNLT